MTRVTQVTVSNQTEGSYLKLKCDLFLSQAKQFKGLNITANVSCPNTGTVCQHALFRKSNQTKKTITANLIVDPFMPKTDTRGSDCHILKLNTPCLLYTQ